MLEHPGAFFPMLEEVPTREETRHRVASQVVQPALLAQLAHTCVNPGVPSATLRPCCDLARIASPRNLLAVRVAFHDAEIGHGVTINVKELSPQELAV